MSEKEDSLSQVDNLELEALSDDELEMVAGGHHPTEIASCNCCTKGSITIINSEAQ